MTQLPHDPPSMDAGAPGQWHAPPDGIASSEATGGVSRRQFLEAAGFTISLGALGGCGRAPVEHAFPPPSLAVGMVPGALRQYASTCAGCQAGCGLLVGTRDGRPLKMEGLPEHPLSRGGLCAVGQADLIGVYDSRRLAGPLRGGKAADWAVVDREIMQGLEQFKGQKKVRLVTPTVTSPTLQAAIGKFLEQFADGKHVVFDSPSSSAILDAHVATHAARVLPHYRFDLADVVVSFGADFLGTWISPVEFTAAWSTRRVPKADAPVMSYHAHFESRMSLTGSNADRRISIHPRDHGPLLGRLAELVAAEAGAPVAEPLTAKVDPELEGIVAELAQRLWSARGKSLVVSDSQDTGVQRVVNFINHQLGNYGATLDLARPSRQRQASDRDVAQLVEDIKNGQVGALLVADVDLLHDLANHGGLAEAVDRIPVTISFAPREDEFAARAKFVCPDHHALESWRDAEPIDGLIGVGQPTIHPLGSTRAVVESLSAWSGAPTTAMAAMKAHWEAAVFPRRKAQEIATFAAFWDKALGDGFVEVEPEPTQVGEFAASAVRPLAPSGAGDDFSLVLYTKVGMLDARYSHNPWLQELPDPVTKATWGNYVCISPVDAERLGVSEGDIVAVSAGQDGPRLELPALVQVGQHAGTLAVALAYGCKGTDRFAAIGPQWLEARPTVPAEGLVGVNAAGFLDYRNGTLQYDRSGVALSKTGGHRPLAITQRFNSLELPRNVAPHGGEYRDIVQRTTLAAFAKDAHAGAVEHHHPLEPQLWPEDHPRPGHAWGMVIDLNKCTGCSACVIACQAENNVPVVGYDEVRRQRDMHWLRIDRYYDGASADVSVAHQPMMCQHCNNAPCETVCPVLATVHSAEGLNEQVYNRCVGTRYCANNCPFKVRRFNWFEYPHPDIRQSLVVNPEVTVRSRGVMEKCSMCVQRIEAARIEARSQGQPIADGAIQTACQQSCPADAIVFGDVKDTSSAVHSAMENPRRYRVLEEMNIRPTVSYLRVVTNRDEEPGRG